MTTPFVHTALFLLSFTDNLLSILCGSKLHPNLHSPAAKPHLLLLPKQIHRSLEPSTLKENQPKPTIINKKQPEKKHPISSTYSPSPHSPPEQSISSLVLLDLSPSVLDPVHSRLLATPTSQSKPRPLVLGRKRDAFWESGRGRSCSVVSRERNVSQKGLGFGLVWFGSLRSERRKGLSPPERHVVGPR